MNYISITRSHDGYITIWAEVNGERYGTWRYLMYNRRDVESKDREIYGLRGKHLTRI